MIGKHECMCHNPFPAFKSRFERVRDHQLRRLDTGHRIHDGHGHDGNDDRKIGEEVSHFAWEVSSVTEVFQHDADDKGPNEENDGHEEHVRLVIAIQAFQDTLVIKTFFSAGYVT